MPQKEVVKTFVEALENCTINGTNLFVGAITHTRFEAFVKSLISAVHAPPVVKYKYGKRVGVEERAPFYATPGAAGADICAAESVILEIGAQKLVSTGLHIAIPEGFEGQIRPRSGIAAKFVVSITNSPGTIDSDYRGEIKVMLINHSCQPVGFKAGDRICQLIIARVYQAEFVKVDDLVPTERGVGGFGSTKI